MSIEEKDRIYRRALERVGMEGVRRFEHDIRVKIEQRTSGGPFALRKAFKQFDRDGSGDIAPDEFFMAMNSFGLQFTEDGVLALFGLYDRQRAGCLGYYDFVEHLIEGGVEALGSPPKSKELSKVRASVPLPPSPPKNKSNVGVAQAKEAFNFLDKKKCGRIELSELDSLLKCLGMSTNSDTVNEALLFLDFNQTGEVDFETFWTWWQDKHSGEIRSAKVGDTKRIMVTAPIRGGFPALSIRSGLNSLSTPTQGNRSPSAAQQYGDVLAGN